MKKVIALAAIVFCCSMTTVMAQGGGGGQQTPEQRAAMMKERLAPVGLSAVQMDFNLGYLERQSYHDRWVWYC
jgi:hypothetical protein